MICGGCWPVGEGMMLSRSSEPGMKGDDPGTGLYVGRPDTLRGSGCFEKLKLEGETGGCPESGDEPSGRCSRDMAPVTGGDAELGYIFAS